MMFHATTQGFVRPFQSNVSLICHADESNLFLYDRTIGFEQIVMWFQRSGPMSSSHRNQPVCLQFKSISSTISFKCGTMLTNELMNYGIVTEDYPFVLLAIFLPCLKLYLKQSIQGFFKLIAPLMSRNHHYNFFF